MKILHPLFKKVFTAVFSIVFLLSPFANANEKASVSTDELTPKEVILAEKVNINTASVETIKTILSGIGEKKAQAIVDYREQHGKFTAIEQIMEVKGIGEAIFEKNKNLLTL